MGVYQMNQQYDRVRIRQGKLSFVFRRNRMCQRGEYAHGWSHLFPFLVTLSVYYGCSWYLGIIDFAYYPFVLSFVFEGLYRFVMRRKGPNELLLIGSSNANMALNPVEVLFNDASTHWVVLFYDTTTKQLHFTHTTGKQSKP